MTNNAMTGSRKDPREMVATEPWDNSHSLSGGIRLNSRHGSTKNSRDR
jgi:hypothetical protein